MKKIFFALSCFFTTSVVAQDYMDKIAQQTCDCSKNMSDTLSKQRMFMELGVCMFQASEPYKKQLKKDYNVNLDNIDEEGEALGKVVGIRMASICPALLIKISEQADKKESDSQQETFTGRVTKIEKEFFTIFTVNHEGKSLKFYWLTNAESNVELINQYTELFDKDVKVKYRVNLLFDPKIGDYRNFNIIERIDQMSR